MLIKFNTTNGNFKERTLLNIKTIFKTYKSLYHYTSIIHQFLNFVHLIFICNFWIFLFKYLFITVQLIYKYLKIKFLPCSKRNFSYNSTLFSFQHISKFFIIIFNFFLKTYYFIYFQLKTRLFIPLLISCSFLEFCSFRKILSPLPSSLQEVLFLLFCLVILMLTSRERQQKILFYFSSIFISLYEKFKCSILFHYKFFYNFRKF